MGMRLGLKNQTGRRPPSICRGDGEEFAALFEAIESSGQFDSPKAERRLRPLARRRANTSRPFLVAIRARKPCRRARTSLLGWYVRFTVTPVVFEMRRL